MSPSRSNASRLAFAVLAAGLVVLPLSGCSAIGLGKKSVSVSLTASADCNNCGKASAQPLEFEVLQVSDPGPIAGTSLAQVWGKEKDLFADKLLTRDTGSIVPGAVKQPFAFERNPKAKAVIVIGNFCKPDGNCWYFSQDLSKGSKLALEAGASCLARVTKKKKK